MDLVSIDPLEAFASGLKKVQFAYKEKVIILSNEINRLSNELERKTSKIEELEIFTQRLIMDNKQLHQQVERLMENKIKNKSSNDIPYKAVEYPSDNIIKNNITSENTQKTTMGKNTFSIDNQSFIKKRPVSIERRTCPIDTTMVNDYSSKRINSNKLIDTSRQRSYGNASKTHIISSEFIKKLKLALNHTEYLLLIDIIKMSNAKFITKHETFTRIEALLQVKYPLLYSEFKDISHYKDHI